MTDDLDWTGRNSLLIGPLQSAVNFGIASSQSPASGVQIVPTPLASQYVRLMTMTVETFIDPTGHYCADVPCHWALTNDAQSLTFDLGTVGSDVISKDRSWPQGLAFPFGSGVIFLAGASGYADGSLGIACTYTVVG